MSRGGDSGGWALVEDGVQTKRITRDTRAAEARLVQVMSVLRVPARLRLLLALDEGELSVTQLMRATRLRQPNVSANLRVLRDAKLVQRRRVANFALYRPSDATLMRMLLDLKQHLAQTGNTQK
jgi:DNA-binding transcriptional ArsR family regulator